MTVFVAGISAHSHDSAACILRDGRLVAAAQEERFSRIKHDSGLPVRALRYCLSVAGIGVRDLAAVGYFEDPVGKLSRQVWSGVLEDPSPGEFARLDPLRPSREIVQNLGFEGPTFFFEHHHSHAASAFFFSGFEDSAVLVVDGVGEWATTTLWCGHGAELAPVLKVEFPHSVGLLYSTITSFLGFGVNDGEYKVMGLAPYGRDLFGREMQQLGWLDEEYGIRLDMRFFDFVGRRRMYSDGLESLLGLPPRQPGSEIFPVHADIAKSLQSHTEALLLGLVKRLGARVVSENLCIAGGVGLNCVANGRIAREGPFRRLFVQPAAGDSGGALGAAALAHVRLKGNWMNRPMQHAYYGPEYSRQEVQQALVSFGVSWTEYPGGEDQLCHETAKRLADGLTVGWFNGRMEFGPRALGARSILADPRNSLMRERINAVVKKREAFRPFAPAVLQEESGKHFSDAGPSPFMLSTCQVTSKLDLPAVTHVDGSARIQTVDQELSPRFYRLLRKFHEITGCPILLNTSFNMKDEPIVCTPQDALACFARSSLDVLVLGDFLVERAAMSSETEAWVRALARQRPPESNSGFGVYTFL